MVRRALLAAFLALLAMPAWAQSNDPSFRIVNNTAKVVNELYASPSNDRGWGHDRLGSEVIAPGGNHIVRLPTDGNCSYDVRVVYQDRSAEERRNLNTCAMTDLVLGTTGAAPPNRQAGRAANPSFNLVNQTGRVIEQVFASPSSQQDWGPDRLGNETVRPGARFAIRLPAGECNYDLRFVLQGGSAKEQRNVNTCNLTDYVVR